MVRELWSSIALSRQKSVQRYRCDTHFHNHKISSQFRFLDQFSEQKGSLSIVNQSLNHLWKLHTCLSKCLLSNLSRPNVFQTDSNQTKILFRAQKPNNPPTTAE